MNGWDTLFFPIKLGKIKISKIDNIKYTLTNMWGNGILYMDGGNIGTVI